MDGNQRSKDVLPALIVIGTWAGALLGTRANYGFGALTGSFIGMIAAAASWNVLSEPGTPWLFQIPKKDSRNNDTRNHASQNAFVTALLADTAGGYAGALLLGSRTRSLMWMFTGAVIGVMATSASLNLLIEPIAELLSDIPKNSARNTGARNHGARNNRTGNNDGRNTTRKNGARNSAGNGGRKNNHRKKSFQENSDQQNCAQEDNALKNAYRYLGVSMNASNKNVKAAFHRLCLKHHPDKGGSAEQFLLLQLHMNTIEAARRHL